jgi:ABC1 atypical kinase-like domain
VSARSRQRRAVAAAAEADAAALLPRFAQLLPVQLPGVTLCSLHMGLLLAPQLHQQQLLESDSSSGSSSGSSSSSSSFAVSIDEPEAAVAAGVTVLVKRPRPRQAKLAHDDLQGLQSALRKLRHRGELELDADGVLAEARAAVASASDLTAEARSIRAVAANLAAAGLLGRTVQLPTVVDAPQLGPLVSSSLLVTTALRGVSAADARAVAHTAGSELQEWAEQCVAVFAHMLLADGLFPSNPHPGNLLYMRGGAVGLLDLGAVSSVSGPMRRTLCQLYEALARCERSDAAAALTGAATSAASDAAREAELKALLEGLGLAIDLPDGAEPVVSALSSSSSSSSGSSSSVQTDALPAAHSAISYYEIARALFDPKAVVLPTATALTTTTAADVAAVTHHPLDCLQWGGLLRGASIKRVPKDLVPVLRMVACLRGVCAHLGVHVALLPAFSKAAKRGLRH